MVLLEQEQWEAEAAGHCHVVGLGLEHPTAGVSGKWVLGK